VFVERALLCRRLPPCSDTDCTPPLSAGQRPPEVRRVSPIQPDIPIGATMHDLEVPSDPLPERLPGSSPARNTSWPRSEIVGAIGQRRRFRARTRYRPDRERSGPLPSWCSLAHCVLDSVCDSRPWTASRTNTGIRAGRSPPKPPAQRGPTNPHRECPRCRARLPSLTPADPSRCCSLGQTHDQPRSPHVHERPGRHPVSGICQPVSQPALPGPGQITLDRLQGASANGQDYTHRRGLNRFGGVPPPPLG